MHRSAYMEMHLGDTFPVLERDISDKGQHGFVRIIDYMGTDEAIVQAARVSYGAGTKTPSSDEKLINYLMRHNHTSVFEQCEIKLHVKMPIFVARQWVRHRTANLNEISGRYSIINDEFFIPNEILAQSTKNKQGRDGDNELGLSQERIIGLITRSTEEAYEIYNKLIKSGVARETARIILPVNVYTEFYWKVDVHNLLHFLKLRMHEHAQQEIRQYANTIFHIVEQWVPFTAKAFKNNVLNSVTLSANQVTLLKHMVADFVYDKGSFESFIEENKDKLSDAELREFKSLCMDNILEDLPDGKSQEKE